MTSKIIVSSDITPTHEERRKFTSQVLSTLLNAIADGLGIYDACYVAGVSNTTYNRWMKEEPEFVQAIRVAEAEYKRTKLKLISEAGEQKNMWSANAWLLERKWPEQFGKRDAVDVTSGGQPLKAFIGFTPDQWDADDVVEGEVVSDE